MGGPSAMPRQSDGFVQAHESATSAMPVTVSLPVGCQPPAAVEDAGHREDVADRHPDPANARCGGHAQPPLPPTQRSACLSD